MSDVINIAVKASPNILIPQYSAHGSISVTSIKVRRASDIFVYYLHVFICFAENINLKEDSL